MLKTFYTILVITLAISNTGIAQMSVKDSVRVLCTDLAAGEAIEGELVGFGALPSVQWEKYQQLLSIATDSVLFDLTNHDSPVVRGYVFYGLMDRNPALFITALRLHESDTAIVETRNGCFVGHPLLFPHLIEVSYYYFVRGKSGHFNIDEEAYILQWHEIEAKRRRQWALERRNQRNNQ